MRRLIIQILLFATFFIGFLFVCEVFIRTASIANVSSTEFYKDIGRGRRKNLRYLYFNEGFGIGEFNKFRYIGEANSIEKQRNVIRVAVLGDSYIESFQIFERDYFGTIAENILTKKYPDINFEFLNFGRSGFDIADMYAYQNTLLEKFDVDFILYMVSNDDLEPKYADPLRPKALLQNDSLVISYNFKASEINKFNRTKFLTQNSSVLNMLNNCRKKIKKTPLLEVLLDKIYIWYRPASIVYEKDQNILNKIDPVAAKIVETANPEKVIFINRDISRLPDEFQEICLRSGITFFDLSGALDSLRNSGIDPLEWKVTSKRGHWNQNAHKVVGTNIAEQISKLVVNE